MKFINRYGTAALFGIFALSGIASAANIGDMVRDTQRTSNEGGHMSLVWWIPVQFWDESIKSNPAVPDAARAQIVTAMSDYTVVAVLRAAPGAAGLTDLQPKEELLKNTRLEMNGQLVEPLAPEQISQAMTMLLAQLKPALTATIGQVGQGLTFLIYPAKPDGKPPIDASQPGNLNITFYGKSYPFRLPLGSLLPAKVDAKTGEEFPGNYSFNPFTGNKLGNK